MLHLQKDSSLSCLQMHISVKKPLVHEYNNRGCHDNISIKDSVLLPDEPCGISGHSARLSTLAAAAAKTSLKGGCTRGDSSAWTLLEAVKLWPRFSTTRMTRLDRQSRATAHCPSGWAKIHSHSRPCACMAAEIGQRSCNIACAAQQKHNVLNLAGHAAGCFRTTLFSQVTLLYAMPGSVLLSWEWRTNEACVRSCGYGGIHDRVMGHHLLKHDR